MQENIVLQSIDYCSSIIIPKVDKERKYQKKCASPGSLAKTELLHRVFDDHFIETQSKHLKSDQTRKLAYHLGFLSSAYQTRKNFSRPLAIALALCLVATCVYAAADWWLAFGIFAMGSIALSYLLKRSVTQHTVFFSKSGHAPLVYIAHKGQAGNSVKQFVEHLQQRIEASSLPDSINPLPEETKLLRQFYESAFVSESEYQQCRDLILSLYPKRMAGVN